MLPPSLTGYGMITGIALHPDGSHLLSNGSDNTIRCWDVKPFCEGDRCEKVFLGAQVTFRAP